MYSIVRYKTIKTTKTSSAAYEARAQIMHDFRLKDEKYADPEKYEDNRVLFLNDKLFTTKSGEKFHPFKEKYDEKNVKINFKQIFDDHIKTHCGEEYRIKSNAIQALEIMMTASSKRPDDFNEEGWINDSLKWCQEKFGKDNIVFAVLHKDETTPHIHVQIIPTYDGVLNASKHIGKMEKNRELDRSYYEAVKKYGFEKRKMPLHKKHISIAEYRRKIEEAISEPHPIPNGNESIEDYSKRVDQWAESYKIQEYIDLQRQKDEIREEMVDIRMAKKMLDEESMKIDMHKKEYEDMEAIKYMMQNGNASNSEVEIINRLIKDGKKLIADLSKNAGLEDEKSGEASGDLGSAGINESNDR